MRFLQIHALTAYGPSNLNRDEVGQPKSAVFGGVGRIRVSSQCLKRTWRTSDEFKTALDDHLGKRTMRIGEAVHKAAAHIVDERRRLDVARAIVGAFGENEPAVKSEKDDDGKAQEVDNPERLFTKQLVFVSPDEERKALALARKAELSDEERKAIDEAVAGKPKNLRKMLLNETDSAADVAMFGRMLASAPEYNREAAVQVAHAITTHRADAEDDYFSAVDDLKPAEEDMGAGHLGNVEFGAGVFYHYICVDIGQLDKNLAGDTRTRNAAIAALVKAVATTSPKGKQATFASRARAAYILAEKGVQQPRSLVDAFIKPVDGADQLRTSVEALKEWRNRLDEVYGKCADAGEYQMDCTNADGVVGNLNDLIRFAVE